MNTLSIPVVIMASISFYVGLYHLLIYGRRRQHREDLTFALLCLATSLYDVFCIGLYNSSTVAEGVQWQRAQFIALALFTTAFMWFVSDYTHQKPGIVIYAFSAFFLLALFIQTVDRSDLTWMVDHPSIKEVLLPLGLKITYHEATFGPFTTVQSLTGLVASTYILVSGIRSYRRGYKREAGPLLLAMGFVYAAAFNDTAVSNGLYQFVYTIEYGYMAMIFLMAYSLSSTVVEAAIAKETLRASAQRFRFLVETTSDWVWETDQSGVYTYASPKVSELLGYEPQEIIGKTPFDLMPPDEAKRISAILREIMSGPKPFERLENTAQRKDGRLVVLETSGVPFFDANGKLLGYRGIDRDITERKRAEAQIARTLRETRVRFEVSQALASVETEDEVLDVLIQHAGLYPQAHVAILTFDRTGSELAVILRRHDTFESGLIDPTPAGTHFPASSFTLIRLFHSDRPFVSNDLFADERVDPATRELFRPGGVASHASFPLTAGNDWMGYIGVTAKPAGYFDEKRLHLYQTLAEQGAVALRAARLRETIRESQQRLSLLVQQSLLAVIEWNMDLQMVSWNPAAERIFGYTREEALGRHAADLVVPEEAQLLLDQGKQAVLARKGGAHGTYDHLTKDGRRITCEWFSAPLIGADGRVIGVASLVQDITERKRAEEALRRAEEKYRGIVENAVEGIFQSTPDGRFLSVNPAMARMYGYASPDDMTHSVTDITQQVYADPDQRAFLQHRLETEGVVQGFEMQDRRKDGSTFWTSMNVRAVRDEQGKIQYYEGALEDISARKQAEESLKQVNATLQALIDHAPLAIIMLDLNSRVLLWNKAAERMYGWTADEVLGKFLPNVSDDMLEEHLAIRARVLSGESITNLEVERQRKDGSRFHIGLSIAPLRNALGEIYAQMSIGVDITERKRAEATLQMFQYTIDRSLDAVQWLNREAGFEYVNDQACRSLGYTREELMRLRLWDIDPIYPKERWDKNWESYQGSRRGGAENVETLHRRKDGSVFPVEVSSNHLWFGDKELHVAVVRDITERKRAAAALEESESIFRSFVEQTSEGIVLLDERGAVIEWNHAIERMTGIRRDEVLGKPAWEFQFRLLPDERKSPAAYERLKSSYLDILRSGISPWQDRSLEAVFQRTDGSQRKVEQRLFPIRTGQGFSLGGVARDITERKQTEAEKENLIKELEAKNAELERFTYTVSHDLKSPLITIRGFLGFLENDALEGNFERVRSDMERISSATDKMQLLLNELLELSRIGRMMNPSPAVPFEAIAREAVELVGGQINARGVKVEIAADLPTVYGDRARLVEVVQNLIDNAVKFMGDQPEPQITIGQGGTDQDGKSILFVRDNGLGIDPAYHDRVFGLFNKLDAHSEGTGVGLALVKRILEVHGGRIWIESEGAGKGTTFYFTLPQSNS